MGTYNYPHDYVSPAPVCTCYLYDNEVLLNTKVYSHKVLSSLYHHILTLMISDQQVLLYMYHSINMICVAGQ